MQPTFYEPDEADDHYWIRHLTFGMRVDVQLLELQKRRYHVELMGLRIGRYIALRFDPQNWPLGEQLTGMAVVCRYLVEDELGEIFAFKAEVLQLMRFPDHLIFLTFPENVAKRSLRDTARSEVNLPATATFAEKNYVGQITDLSEGGCRLLLPAAPELQDWDKVEVALVIECTQGPKQALTAHVRNHREGREGVSVGLQFVAPQAWVQNLP